MLNWCTVLAVSIVERTLYKWFMLWSCDTGGHRFKSWVVLLLFLLFMYFYSRVTVILISLALTLRLHT